jgi:ATP-dependent helicase/nuclease subunit B
MSRPASRPAVFAIPAGTPQIDTFVEAFRSGVLFGRGPLSPLEIAAARIFVPTRRAGAALAAALAAAAGPAATLLPTILPLGDPDALDEGFVHDAGDAGLPPVIGDLDRRLMLFKLIDAWRAMIAGRRSDEGEAEPFHVGRGRADAFALAGDLARLIEETIIEGVPLARLASGVPEEYRPERHSRYWEMTETFLKIAAGYYPEALRDVERMDPAEAITRRLMNFAAGMAERQPCMPIVVFGSTGSVSATAGLMAAVARLPAGAVVLPGLDLTAQSEAYWPLIGADDADLPTRYAHPQGLLKRTLSRIGIAREEVQRLPAGALPSPRETLVAELFRPAAATDVWNTAAMAGPALDAATSGIALIEANDEREEALCIALLLRETLESPGRTAALITPDRSLSRAVQAELQRWGVTVADSAGEALSNTPVAVLARLALRAAAADAGAVEVLALLRHPLARLGMAGEASQPLLDAIEIAALSGKRLAGGIAGLPGAIAVAMAEDLRHAPQPRLRVTPEALAAAHAHATRLAEAFASLHQATNEDCTLRCWARAHRALVELLLCPDPAVPGALEGDAGIALAAVFDTVAQAAEAGPEIDLTDYAAMFDELLAGRVVRPRQPGHPRLKIWGLLEARLLDADRLILAGLDEGVWPPEMRGDPFLNRPMRIALGLQPPERRIGQTAHDFMMLLGAPDVVLTRAKKRGGSPAIASRFLRRLTAFIGEEETKALHRRGRQPLAWARAIDAPAAEPTPVAQPSPIPPAELTPERLSLTEIETLYRDPYVLFARRILRLDRLEPVDPPLDARERGTIVHEALSRFTKRFAGALPADAEAELLSFGAAAFAEVQQQDPEAVQFWLRRFEAFVPWFVAWDRKRREGIAALHSEIGGAHVLDLPGGRNLTLSGRADRIEQRRDGSLAIIDYKTGTPPSKKEVLSGLAPQLTLTAALAARRAFRDLPSVDLASGVELAYLHVAKTNGQGEMRGIEPEKPKKPKKGDPAPSAEPPPPLHEIIETQFENLQRHLGLHVTGKLGYRSRRRPKKVSYVGDYDHLARVAEWSRGGAEEPTERGE